MPRLRKRRKIEKRMYIKKEKKAIERASLSHAIDTSGKTKSFVKSQTWQIQVFTVFAISVKYTMLTVGGFLSLYKMAKNQNSSH